MNNREIMARNIKRYMEKGNYNAADVCKACGFKQNTFSDWVNGKTYPRIDKIETMAKFFGCSVTDLVGVEVVFDSRTMDRLLAYAKRLTPEGQKQLTEYAKFLAENKNDN